MHGTVRFFLILVALGVGALLIVSTPPPPSARSQTPETDACTSSASATPTPTIAPVSATPTPTPIPTTAVTPITADGAELAPIDATDTPVADSSSPPPDPTVAPTPLPTPTPTPVPLPVSTDSGIIDPAVGGSVMLGDDSVKVSFDAGDVPERVAVTISRVAPCEQHSSTHDVLSEIRLTATAPDRGDAEVTSFDQPIDLEIRHTLEELIAYNPQSLALYRLNESTGEWEVIPSQIGPEPGTVRAALDHFSIYSSQADPDIVLPPDVQFFQADPQSLSSSTSIPLDLPVGPGGMKPDLNLSYSSASVNEMKSRTTTGSWVGVGWNLGVPSIVKDPFGTYYEGSPRPLRGRLFLNMNGASDLIVRENSETSPGSGTYRFHTTHDSYLYILGKLCGDPALPDSYYEFTVRTKDGTKYEFGVKPGGPSCAYADAGTANAPTSLQYFTRLWTPPNDWHRYYYRMDISRITDTRGNYIDFNYWQNVRTDCAGQLGCPSSRVYVRAAYPSRIDWGAINVPPGTGHVYRVLFNQEDFDSANPEIGGWDLPEFMGQGGVGRVRSDSPIDTDTGDGICQPHVMEVRSLTSVRIINLATGGDIIREYVPGYDKSDGRDSRGPGVCAISGNLKLTSWTGKGRNGAATLRTMTFEYVGTGNSDFQLRYRNGSAVDCESANSGAKPRPFISKAENGFGGEVRFTYRETWATPSGQICGWERMAVSWRTTDPDGTTTALEHPHFYESLPIQNGVQAPPVYKIPDVSVKPEDAEFRGFAQVRDTDDASNDYSECYYEVNDEDRIGKPNACSWHESSGSVVRSLTYTYSDTSTCSDCAGWDAPYFSRASFTRLDRVYEHVTGKADIWTDYVYDGYGNIQHNCEYASVPPSAGCPGGGTWTRKSSSLFVANTSEYIVDKPYQTWIRGPNETALSNIAYYYDLGTNGAPLPIGQATDELSS